MRLALHDPLFKLGIVDVHPFPLIVAIALVCAYVLALWRVAQAGLPARLFPGTFLFVVLAAFMGARLDYVAGHHVVAADGLTGALEVWRGGLGLAGGVLGGAVGLLALTWSRRQSFRRWLDAVAPAAALGLAIGALGLPSGGEGWGMPTRGPFSMSVDASRRPIELIGASRFHPIFAYDAALFGGIAIMALALAWLWRRNRGADGAAGLIAIALALLGYGATRPLSLDALTTGAVLQAQVLCALGAAAAIGVLVPTLWGARRRAQVSSEGTFTLAAQTRTHPSFTSALKSSGRSGAAGNEQRRT